MVKKRATTLKTEDSSNLLFTAKGKRQIQVDSLAD